VRLREHGLCIGRLETGARNSIADVGGITVGHVTVRRDEAPPPEGRGRARTGVTAVVPSAADSLVGSPLAAGAAVLNGAGELTSFIQIQEWGVIQTPVYLTSTMAVGRIYDGAVSVARTADPDVGVSDVVIPTVGECDDSWLSDARVVQVEAADAGRAVEAAASTVEEGAVGAGTGMRCLGWKGGIGTSSRVVGESEAVLGALVLTNFGPPGGLRMDGVPVGSLLDDAGDDRSTAGSCIVVLATDAGLSAKQLERVARRAGLGLARTGSVAHHGSGEIFVAFSTAGPDRPRVPDVSLDPLFVAAVDSTEESVLNSLWAAKDVEGRDANRSSALPHEPVLELLRAHGRLSQPRPLAG
jgi:D-aminopeptidase